MPVFSSLRSASAAPLLATLVALAAVGDATTYLSPAQDIVLPASGSASNPLEWLGANGPYFAGMLFMVPKVPRVEAPTKGFVGYKLMENRTQCQ